MRRNGEGAKMPSDGNKEEEEGDGEAHQRWDGKPRPTLFRPVPRTKRYLMDVKSTSLGGVPPLLKGVPPLLDNLDALVGQSSTPTDSQSICLGLEHNRSFSS
ncbi:hypothetical protein ACFX19_003428 [Malus domestica]